MESNENSPHVLKRIAWNSLNNIAFSKLYSGVTYGAEAYVYKPVTIADMELSSVQCLLLVLLNSLVNGDVRSCLLLANVCQQVRQLRSKYLRVWLTDDFSFARQDMEKAIALLGELVATGLMKLPFHVMKIMVSVAMKYGIADAQLRSSEDFGGGLAMEMENAVCNNNPGDIITLVSMGGDVNGLNQTGDSLLHLAARTGSCAAIATLGIFKANLEMVNSAIATPLEEAVRNNNVQSVRALLLADAKIDNHLLRGDTYLHLAAAGGQNGALLALLEGGLAINIKNHLGETPLFQAVRAGNVCGVDVLLERGADLRIVPEGSKGLVEIVVASQDVSMFKVFMKGKTLPPVQPINGDSIFHIVANFGNTEMLKILKDKRLAVNVRNQKSATPLHVASDISIIRTLLEMDLDIDAADNTGSTALMIAIENSKAEITKFLLNSGANPILKDNHNMTPLHYAAMGGHVEIVRALLEAGARVEEKNNDSKTPAFVAAVNNKLNVLELLAEHGADLTVKDSTGDGMIHHASRSGYSDIVSMLLGAGVMVDMKGKGEVTPLHCAAEEGHASVVSVLLNRGADVKAKARIPTSLCDIICLGCSWTPLIAASKVGNLDVVKLLLEEGAPVNDRDTWREWTALTWAVNYNHTSVADYLRAEGGSQ